MVAESQAVRSVLFFQPFCKSEIIIFLSLGGKKRQHYNEALPEPYGPPMTPYLLSKFIFYSTTY